MFDSPACCSPHRRETAARTTPAYDESVIGSVRRVEVRQCEQRTSTGSTELKDVVIIDGARTPFGTFGGGLRDVSATDLGVIASKAAIERSKVDPKQIDQVIFGNVLQTSGDAVYLARHIGLKSGIPKEV